MKILGQIKSSYGRAICFGEVYPLIEDIFNDNEKNLFRFIYNSLVKIKEYLSIATPLVISSGIAIDHDLKSKHRVMELCKALGGDTYINPVGGMELYDKEEFKANGIDLHFHKMRPITYPQYGDAFIPSLSILDVMMFNPREKVQQQLKEYDLI